MKYLGIYTNKLIFFTQLYQCHLELEKVEGPSSLCLDYFPSSKNFNHIAKDASFFHLKSSDNCRFSYFLTPISIGHTSHHHARPIVGDWLLTWRNMADLLQWSIFDMETFWHLVWSKLTSCKFSLFLFIIPLYIFQIYDVLINKVLQGYIIIYFDY